MISGQAQSDLAKQACFPVSTSRALELEFRSWQVDLCGYWCLNGHHSSANHSPSTAPRSHEIDQGSDTRTLVKRAIV